ncbi:hypothetical protein WS62_21150 [Burkholderia sp. ABCPW 14]|nr:hypothetical protein WS62_21150 [Burkholderia sp. ABCPW 14]
MIGASRARLAERAAAHRVELHRIASHRIASNRIAGYVDAQEKSGPAGPLFFMMPAARASFRTAGE